jgi:hypothetical protein
MKAGKNQKQIAGLLGWSAGTICRELRRNSGDQGYRPKQAQAKADTRRKQAVKAVKMTAVAIVLIEQKLMLDWNPEQVAGWLGPNKASRSATNAFTSTSGRTSGRTARCICIFDKATSSAKSNTDQRINEARSGTVPVLTNALPLLPKKPALATGRLTPSSAGTIKAPPWSR